LLAAKRLEEAAVHRAGHAVFKQIWRKIGDGVAFVLGVALLFVTWFVSLVAGGGDLSRPRAHELHRDPDMAKVFTVFVVLVAFVVIVVTSGKDLLWFAREITHRRHP